MTQDICSRMKRNNNKGKREHADLRDEKGYKPDSPFKCQINYYLQKNDLEEVEKSKHEKSP